MVIQFLKRMLILFIPLVLIGLTFTNCDSSGALKLIGPEVEIDLDGNIKYKAVDPGFANACVEITLPINIKPEDVREELVSYILAQTNNLSTFALSGEVFDVNKLQVSYGACPTKNLDATPASCLGKSINKIPVEHDFGLLTYNDQVSELLFAGTAFESNIVESICGLL